MDAVARAGADANRNGFLLEDRPDTIAAVHDPLQMTELR